MEDIKKTLDDAETASYNYGSGYLQCLPTLLLGMGSVVSGSTTIGSQLNDTASFFQETDYPQVIRHIAEKSDNCFHITGTGVSHDYGNEKLEGYIDLDYQFQKISILKKIDNFSKLEKGWNGYNADPISGSVIQSAKNLVLKLQGLPSVFPTARNSIQIEYEDFETDNYIEIEVFEDNELLYIESGDNVQELANKDVTFINKKINELDVA